MTDDGVRERLGAIRESIDRASRRAGRSDEVKLVAVSKTVDVARIRAAIDAGQYVFGENRVQEALAKIDRLSSDPTPLEWHLLGHLQTNKVARAARAFSCIESVDSFRLASALDRAAAAHDARVSVLLEVNVAGEASKSGFRPDELDGALESVVRLTALQPRGLMTVAPVAPDPEDVRWVFRHLCELRDSLRERYALADFSELSMGMSDDFRVAIEEGATIVRIGRALFGDRPALPETN